MCALFRLLLSDRATSLGGADASRSLTFPLKSREDSVNQPYITILSSLECRANNTTPCAHLAPSSMLRAPVNLKRFVTVCGRHKKGLRLVASSPKFTGAPKHTMFCTIEAVRTTARARAEAIVLQDGALEQTLPAHHPFISGPVSLHCQCHSVNTSVDLKVDQLSNFVVFHSLF